MANQKIATFSLKDMSSAILSATKEQIDIALEACGIQAASYAMMYATSKGVVDTGLLRNSITYALGGKIPAVQDYHADNISKFGGKIVPSGRYEGKAPKDSSGIRTVYIGSNVKYAVYNEMGTTRMGARPFLRPALEDHIGTYKELFVQCLSKLGK